MDERARGEELNTWTILAQTCLHPLAKASRVVKLNACGVRETLTTVGEQCTGHTPPSIFLQATSMSPTAAGGLGCWSLLPARSPAEKHKWDAWKRAREQDGTGRGRGGEARPRARTANSFCHHRPGQSLPEGP